jgi:hypothetical protein
MNRRSQWGLGYVGTVAAVTIGIQHKFSIFQWWYLNLIDMNQLYGTLNVMSYRVHQKKIKTETKIPVCFYREMSYSTVTTTTFHVDRISHWDVHQPFVRKNKKEEKRKIHYLCCGWDSPTEHVKNPKQITLLIGFSSIRSCTVESKVFDSDNIARRCRNNGITIVVNDTTSGTMGSH